MRLRTNPHHSSAAVRAAPEARGGEQRSALPPLDQADDGPPHGVPEHAPPPPAGASGLGAWAGRYPTLVVATLAGTALLSSLAPSHGDTPQPVRSPRPAPSVEVTRRTRGQAVLDRLAVDLERKMRVSARDLARGVPLDPDHPSYRALTQGELGSLIGRALEEMPLGELPGGHALAALVERLPGASELDVVDMSYKELSRALPKASKERLYELYGDTLRKNRVAIAILFEASVIGARAASPEVARILDRVYPKQRLWGLKSEGGALSVELNARFRDARVLPDAELRGEARRDVGGVAVTASSSVSAALSPPRGGGGPHPMRAELALAGKRGGGELKLATSIDERSRVRVGTSLSYGRELHLPNTENGRLELYAEASTDTRRAEPAYGAGLLVHFEW